MIGPNYSVYSQYIGRYLPYINTPCTNSLSYYNIVLLCTNNTNLSSTAATRRHNIGRYNINVR